MRFLVTGGAGFIGSHLVEGLLAAKHHVIVVDDFSSGSTRKLPKSRRLTIINKDILRLKRTHFEGQVDGVAHLAAVRSVDQSWESPMEAHRRNLTGTLRMIQLSGEMAVGRFVF